MPAVGAHLVAKTAKAVELPILAGDAQCGRICQTRPAALGHVRASNCLQLTRRGVLECHLLLGQLNFARILCA